MGRSVEATQPSDPVDAINNVHTARITSLTGRFLLSGR